MKGRARERELFSLRREGGRRERDRDARARKKGERVWREKEEGFPPRASPRDGKISVARERGKERKLGGEKNAEKRESGRRELSTREREREKVRREKTVRAGKGTEERERDKVRGEKTGRAGKGTEERERERDYETERRKKERGRPPCGRLATEAISVARRREEGEREVEEEEIFLLLHLTRARPRLPGEE